MNDIGIDFSSLGGSIAGASGQIMSTLSSGLQAYGAGQSLKSNLQDAMANLAILKENKKDLSEKQKLDSEALQKQSDMRLGTAKISFASRGVMLGSGTSGQAVSQFTRESAREMYVMGRNYDNERRSLQMKIFSTNNQIKNIRRQMTMNVIAGAIQTGVDFIGSAASLGGA